VAEDFITTGESSPGFDAYMGVAPEDAPSVIAKWVEREGLAQAFSPQERAYMLKEAGQWTRQETMNGSWRREALLTLEWALQIVQPMPPADVQIPLEDVLEGGWLLKETSRLRKQVSLLSPAEIHKQRDVAEFWLWRSRTWTLEHYSEEQLKDHKLSGDKLMRQRREKKTVCSDALKMISPHLTNRSVIWTIVSGPNEFNIDGTLVWPQLDLQYRRPRMGRCRDEDVAIAVC
jgi:hypothetical protein